MSYGFINRNADLAYGLPNFIYQHEIKFQLLGLLVAIGCFALIRVIAAEEIKGQIAAAFTGVTIVVFGQIFVHIKRIPKNQRTLF